MRNGMGIRYWIVEMTLKFEESRVLQSAETVADGIWGQVVQWDPFVRLDPIVRDVFSGQMARAADSIETNI